GFLVLIPVSLLLALSYFLLFANGKTDSPELKSFGVVVSVLLWVSAGLILLGGLYVLATGHHPMEPFMHQMMQGACQVQ
ncbi:MAG: hypothetical protein ACYC5N_03485, partial [Endomicrobiales bacterium]